MNGAVVEWLGIVVDLFVQRFVGHRLLNGFVALYRFADNDCGDHLGHVLRRVVDLFVNQVRFRGLYGRGILIRQTGEHLLASFPAPSAFLRRGALPPL